MKGLVAAVVLAIVLLVGSIAAVQHHSARTVTFRVEDKLSKGSSGTYLILTNHGVFKDGDALWFGKFNSSDVYGQLQVGHEYTCRVFGWRSHFLSWYPDILSCKAVLGA